MKNSKIISLIIIIIFLMISLVSHEYMSEYSSNGTENRPLNKYVDGLLNQFVNKVMHPCKICGQKILLGKICQPCRHNLTKPYSKPANKKSIELSIDNDKNFEIKAASMEVNSYNTISVEF